MKIALAAPHKDAIAAGERAARQGGNALDVALSAALMLTVVYPHQCTLGGDLIALVRAPSGRTTAVLAAGTAPSGIAAVANHWTEVPRQGPHSVTVPGIVAGLGAIAGLGARLGLASAFTEAASVADQGTAVSAGLERALITRSEAVLADPGLRKVFGTDGRLLQEGELLRQRALAATMRRLAADPADFYRGDVAALLVDALSRAGGTHTLTDFNSYTPDVVDSLAVSTGGRTWHVAPPPSVGAILIGVVGNASCGGVSTPDGRRVLDAAILGVHARAAHLGDPRTSDVDVDALLALRPDRRAAPFTEPRPLGDTAAVTALDEDGWGVTIVQSVYQTFGSGLLDEKTGILFHNRGSAFSVDSASPAAIRPGARPPHTLCPAIVDAPGATVVAGCQGGRAQAWILAQLLPDATDGSRDLEDILGRPRWVVGDRDLGHDTLTFVFEPGVPRAVIAHAEHAGLPVVAFPGLADEAGHVQLVRSTPGGALEASSDPRADGIGITLDATTIRRT